MSRPARWSFVVAFAGIASVYFLYLTGEAVPALAAWLTVPVLLLSAALVGWKLERREERRATSAEGG